MVPQCYALPCLCVFGLKQEGEGRVCVGALFSARASY